MFSKRVYCLKYDRQVNKVKRTTNEYRLTSQEHSTHLPSFHFSPLLRFFFSPSRHVSSLTLQIITRQLCYNTLKRAIISCVCCTISSPNMAPKSGTHGIFNFCGNIIFYILFVRFEREFRIFKDNILNTKLFVSYLLVSFNMHYLYLTGTLVSQKKIIINLNETCLEI
jgi:hypothetical protein